MKLFFESAYLDASRFFDHALVDFIDSLPITNGGQYYNLCSDGVKYFVFGPFETENEAKDNKNKLLKSHKEFSSWVNAFIKVIYSPDLTRRYNIAKLYFVDFDRVYDPYSYIDEHNKDWLDAFVTYWGYTAKETAQKRKELFGENLSRGKDMKLVVENKKRMNESYSPEYELFVSINNAVQKCLDSGVSIDDVREHTKATLESAISTWKKSHSK